MQKEYSQPMTNIPQCSILFVLPVLVLSMVSPSPSATSEPAKVITLDFSAMPKSALQFGNAKWTMGHYIRVDRSSTTATSFYVFDVSGRQMNDMEFSLPDADRIELHDYAAGPDGLISLCGWAYSGEGHRISFIATQASNGSAASVVRSNPYSPWLLTVAPDGTIWTMGTEDVVGTDGHLIGNNAHADALRHFRRDGTVIASGMPQNNAKLSRLVDGYLVATNDRVGLYSPTHGEGNYIEITASTFQLTGFPAVPLVGERPSINGFTATPSGEVYALMQSGQVSRSFTLYRLDRNAKTWSTISVRDKSSENFWKLYGSNGESLVLAGSNKTRLLFVDPR